MYFRIFTSGIVDIFVFPQAVEAEMFSQPVDLCGCVVFVQELADVAYFFVQVLEFKLWLLQRKMVISAYAHELMIPFYFIIGTVTVKSELPHSDFQNHCTLYHP